MNLATARSSRRLKEVGVRKVVGSSRVQLIQQFLLESVIVSVLSLLVACALVVLLLPAFNEFLGTEITFDVFENAYILIGLIILIGLNRNRRGLKIRIKGLITFIALQSLESFP